MNRETTAYINCHYVKEDEAHRLSITNEGHNNTHTCHLGFEGNVSAFISGGADVSMSERRTGTIYPIESDISQNIIGPFVFA